MNEEVTDELDEHFEKIYDLENRIKVLELRVELLEKEKNQGYSQIVKQQPCCQDGLPGIAVKILNPNEIVY